MIFAHATQAFHFPAWAETVILGIVSTLVFGACALIIRWIHNFIVSSVEARVSVDPEIGEAVKRIEHQVGAIAKKQNEVIADIVKLTEEVDDLNVKIEKHLSWHEGHDG